MMEFDPLSLWVIINDIQGVKRSEAHPGMTQNFDDYVGREAYSNFR